MSTRLDQRLRQHLDDLRSEGLARRAPAIGWREGVRYQHDGRWVTGFCSNDYLGFADHPALRATVGSSGAGASRLVCGDLPEHRAAERALADMAGTPDAVLFPSGFQLNVGVPSALLEPGDLVYSDALSHASLIDGLRLARVKPTILPHLQAPAPSAELAWWICESIFSMDGDAIEPAELRRFTDAGGCLYLDEAHSFGLFPGGSGFARHHRLAPTVLVGTLGKSFGIAGAFVAASATVCTWLRTRARSFVFSTGVAPFVAAAICNATALVAGPEGDARRDRLWANARRLADHLGRPAPVSPIFPVVVGDNHVAVALGQALLERGWHVQAIRPPTVPRGTARLRITVTAEHTPEQIDAFVADLLDLLARRSLPDAEAREDPRQDVLADRT